MKRLFYLLFCLVLGIGLVSAQTVKVTGTVVAEDGEEVIGASIVVKGTPTGTVTNFDGTFQLDVPQSATTLVVSYIGMKTQEVAIKPVMHITLQSDSQSLDEVVVVGYGTQRKKDVTSAISRVGGEDLSNLTAASFDSQLAGRAAGVQVYTPSGVLGAAPEFQIRGSATISSNSQPLVIVDGIPMTTGDVGLYGNGTGYNALADISPNDIQSIEILKDGAATAIYGSRAANGVVLITTKKGSKGSVKVSYDGYVALSTVARNHNLLNGKDFVDIANEMYVNLNQPTQAVYDGTETNWNDYVYRSAFQHNHSLSASGGTDKTQYYFSVSYSNQEGIIRSNELERYTVKGDLTQQANKWLTIGLNMQGTRSSNNGVLNGPNNLSGASYASMRMLPNVPVYSDEHESGYNISGKALGGGSNLKNIDDNTPNIIWVLDNYVDRLQNTRVIGGGWAEIKFMEGLTLKTQGGMDLGSSDEYVYRPPGHGDGESAGGYIYDYRITNKNWNWQNILNFYRTFNSVHNVAATLVQEYTYNEFEYMRAYVSSMADVYYTDHIISNTYDNQTVAGTKTSNGLASYLIRANYNYDSKYYIGGSVRRDGLSRLPSDSRWGTFYGISAAWRLSREGFWQGSALNDWFNDFRFRASYATIGNSNIGYASQKGTTNNDYPYMDTYNSVKYGDYTASRWNNMGNNNLKWETTETFDLGIDGSLFNSRLNFEIAYWQKESKDLVMQVPTSPALGLPYNSYFANVGKVKNSGIEISLNGQIISNKDFSWSADLNFSTTSNTVKQLNNGNDIFPDTYTIVREGESFRSIYGYEFYGINQVNGNPVWYKADGSLVQYDIAKAGYVKYDEANPSDTSTGSTLSTSDRKILGNSIPKWYGGFNNTFKYRDFDLNLFFRFSGGNKVANVTRQTGLLNMKFANKGKEVLGRWQSVDNPGDGSTPKLAYNRAAGLFNDGYADSRYVENGSFLKLSNITLGYTVPKQALSKLDISKIRVYMQVQNVFTITGYKGLDPEARSTTTDYGIGVDYNSIPQQRIFTLGANVTF